MTDDEASNEVLKGASLLGEEGDVRRPKTITQKANELTKAVRDLGTQNLESTKNLTAAIQSVADAMSRTSAARQAEEIKTQAEEIKSLRGDITGMKSSLDQLLFFFKADHLDESTKDGPPSDLADASDEDDGEKK